MRFFTTGLVILLFTLLFGTSDAQTDTTLTLQEVEVRANIISKGGIVEYFREIFDLKMLKRSFFTYSLSFNSDLRQAKNTFEDSSGIHVYIRPYVDSQTFWPVIWKKIAESFYQDKINPSLEYKILFTPVDTSVYSAHINPTGESPDPNNPVDFGILDDTRQFGGIYDSLRVQVIDTLILLFTGADLAGMPQQNDSTGLTLFYPAADQNAGFDRFSYDDKYAPLRSTYPVYTINGQTGYLSYKSVKTGVPDVLNAFNAADSLTILYKKDDGTPVNVAPLQGDTVQLTVTGSQEGEFDLISYYESGEDAIETGRIRVATYQNKPLNLVLVPVNGNDYTDKASESEIRNKLNKIYGQASVTWTVSTHPGINIYYDSDGNPTFDCLPDQYQNYTTDMQHAIDVLAVNPPQNTYYLFILDQADSLEVIGLMPFLQPYGFVFLNGHENENELVKTIGHELGHGAFGLEHEFFLYPSISEGDPNLMTWHRTDGSLRKYQWDWIQNPFCMIDGNCGQGINEAMMDLDDNLTWQPNTIKFEICKVTGTLNNNPSNEILTSSDIDLNGFYTVFLPLNNDDDDCNYIDDINDVSVIGESDLVKIVVKGIEKNSGYYHFESNNNNIRIWETPTKDIQQIFTTVNNISLDENMIFEATEDDKALYIEGINPGISELSLVWTNNEKGNKTRILSTPASVTIFEKEGPRYVPEKSVYDYKINTSGTLGIFLSGNNTTSIVQSGNVATVEWGNGPNIGSFVYKANNNFFWNFEVDIVKVEISQNGTNPYIRRGMLVRDNAPHFVKVDSYNSAWFRSGNLLVSPRVDNAGIVFDANIQLFGPSGYGVNNRGVKKIQVGWLQNVRHGVIRTDYNYTPQLAPDIASVSPTTYVDYSTKTAPTTVFYTYLDYSGVAAGNGIPVVEGDILSKRNLMSYDNPDLIIRLVKMGSGNNSIAQRRLAHGIYALYFTLYICAKTTDSEVSLNSVYTPYKYCEWNCHLEDVGDNIYGNMDPPYVAGSQSIHPNSMISLPAGGVLQNWNRELSPTPISTGPASEISPDATYLFNFFQKF